MERAEMEGLIAEFLRVTGWTVTRLCDTLAHKPGFGGFRSVEQWVLRIRNGKASRITSTRVQSAISLFEEHGVRPNGLSAHVVHLAPPDLDGVGGEIMVKADGGEWEAVGFRDAERYKVGTRLIVKDHAGEYEVRVERLKGKKVFLPIDREPE